jgi:hypothetical protein
LFYCSAYISAADEWREIILRYLMLEWLFGSKKEEQKASKEDELGKDEKWVYDYVRQYLISPIWRNPLLDFIEENCLLFEDQEENKFEYTKVFQEFTGLSALLLESMIEEIGISEKTLEKCIIKGIRSERDNKIFRQILLCDNFLAFKKMMITKNKELEVEALTKIHQQAPKEGTPPPIQKSPNMKHSLPSMPRNFKGSKSKKPSPCP